jgi:hypothetical protein
MKIVIYILIFLTLISCADENKLVSPVKFEGKYGFIDENGDWLIKPSFDSTGVFFKGFADVYKNEKAGLINSNGKLVVEYKYEYIEYYNDKIALVGIDNAFNLVHFDQKILFDKNFYDVGDFSEGFAPVKFSENGKWGYLNEKGEIKIDTLYDYADIFEDGNGLVELGEFEFLINKRGKIIDTIESPGLEYKKYKVIGKSDFGTLGKVTLFGDTIMPMKYSSFGYVQKDKFWFKEKNKFGIADTTGKILIEPIYEDLTYFCDNGLAKAKKNGYYGFIDENGEVVIDFKFKDVHGFKYGLAAAKLDDKWGFIDKKGEFVIEPKFDRIEHQFRPINAEFESMYNYQLNY